ncbi:MAG TPA: CotH kinase family protein, partial [Polyangiaceae bacterium]|nr:CotH kinase family protein [Polyangiaceae bacterium]
MRLGNSWWGLSGWLVLCGCGGEDRIALDPGQSDALAEEASEAFYDFEHRVEIEIELSPADWQALRNEGRSLAELFDPSLPFEYTSFVGSVSIDGERYEQVQLRKKGFLGSLSVLEPALKLDLGDTISGQSHRGVRRLTLNNDKQDPSHTHTCLAYRAFARAGLPASRCNLAHVIVNGEDLGTYSNVEPVDKRLLRRHFASDEGNLYEAQAADVLNPTNPRLQAKTNEAENNRSDLVALAAAVEAADDELVASLGAQLDLEQFRTFWAAETLLGHWDGYSGNTNNYFIYRDPVSQRFSFLPWGTDSAFVGSNPFDTVNRDVSVYAAGRIANRLYALPAERERFRARLGELAESVWDEAVLLGEVDQVEALASDASPSALAAQRQHIASHREVLRAALAAPARDWDDSG